MSELSPSGIRAVQIIVREIGTGWEFGWWDSEELLQQAYVWAIEKLPKWNPEKGNLYTFLNTVIRRNLLNLRRDKYERVEKPCCECEICESAKTEEERKNCSVYSSWLARNERKKSLMTGKLVGDVVGGDKTVETLPEVWDELEYYRERVRDKTGFDLMAAGKPISHLRKKSLLSELVRIHNEREA